MPASRALPTVDPGARGARLRARGDFARAEPLLRASLALAEAAEPVDVPRLVRALNALGLLCKDVARYDEARALYQRALALLGGERGADRDAVATLFHNLGGIEHACGDCAAGEPLARRGLELRRSLGPAASTDVAADTIALAALLDGQGKWDEAERLYRDALRTLEHATSDDGSATGEIAVALNGLGALCARRGWYDRARDLLERAAALKRATLGPRHPDLAVTLNNLALTQSRRGEHARALALYGEAVEIAERSLGAGHPRTVVCRANLARCAALTA